MDIWFNRTNLLELVLDRRFKSIELSVTLNLCIPVLTEEVPLADGDGISGLVGDMIDPRTNERELPNQAAAVESGCTVERRPTNEEYYPTLCSFLGVGHFSWLHPR